MGTLFFKMKSISNTYRFITLTLAFLMLTTSVGFAVDMHYCQGQLKSVSFFGRAKTCHETADAIPTKKCSHHQKMMEQKEGCSMDKKDCCQNITLHFQSDQDRQVQTSDFMISKQLQQFVIVYAAGFFTNDFSIECDAASFNHYKPPLLLRNIPVLIQSFLL